MKCHLCDFEAIAIYEFDEGCVCSKETIQSLCEHHIRKATPLGAMILIKDLTLTKEYTRSIQSSFKVIKL